MSRGCRYLVMRSERADVGDPHHRRARLVGGGEVDLGADAPVVVAGRVVEDLPDRPPLLGRSSIISSAGPRASGPVPISSYSAKYGSSASAHASASQPSSASSSPSSS